MNKFEELKAELKTMCPNCDGSGTIANGITKSQMDMEGYEIGIYIEWETEQCQWCYNFDLKFDKLIQTAIAEHEAAQWKAFPDNKPTEKKMYFVQTNDDQIWCWKWMNIISSGWDNVIAFRELPKSYQP